VAEVGARVGITALPAPSSLLVARYLGHSSEAARQWFVGLWQLLRPALLGVAAQTPRIWST
jgi:urease accessory protein